MIFLWRGVWDSESACPVRKLGLSKVQVTVREGTFYVQATGGRVYPVVTTNGTGIVSHVGTVLLAEVADRFGVCPVRLFVAPRSAVLNRGAQ